MNLIELSGVSKVFKTYARESDRVKEFLSFGRWRRHSEHWALQDVSLEIRKGETFCIIGENGSGKTTMLKIIGGIVRPTGGSVKVSGRVNALLELGSGFNDEFTGRENVFLTAPSWASRPERSKRNSTTSSHSPRSATSLSSRSRPIRAAWSSGWPSPSPCSSTPRS